MMAEQLTKTDALTREVFVTGSEPVETTEVVVASGLTIAAREVLAMNKSTGKVVKFDNAGSNGANQAVFIAPYAIDSTGGEVSTMVYKSGTFNPELIVWANAASDAVKASAFAGTPISLQTPQA